MVSMVMPVKWAAIKSRSPKENWKSQLVSMYSGSIEAIFAVESEDDGAVQVVKELQEELAHLEGVTIKVAVAGPATTCSQKIANILAALRAVSPESRYIFCMDANCKLHPGTVHLMMNELENDASVFVATGYPFDMPPENASIWAWTMAQFRYNCLSEFLSNRSTFVWGGAMVLRRADVEQNMYGLLDWWRKGGYSDDMQVQACAQDAGRMIATPLSAIFPNELKKDVTFDYCWGFLRRQNWVLFTYSSWKNWARHMTLLFLYAVPNASWLPAFLLSLASLAEAPLRPARLTEPAVAIHLAACVGFLITFHAAIAAIANMCNHLSPEAQRLSLAQFTPFCLGSSLLMQSALAPAVTIANLLNTSMEWGNIRYECRWGRVVEVQHPHSSPVRVSQSLT
uniref:ceramide glucosyltransferase n=1 Tax=Emiliania huxleyi TaxID=2903 RepID=A0A068EZM1_EMIHU|nr:ceramide glucosyltransferase 2 [Emiliania huxleyi]